MASTLSREEQMASTCVDPVLHNLDLLKDNLRAPDWYKIGFGGFAASSRALRLKLQFLRTFVVCATKWRNKNNDIYLESSDNEKVMTLQSFLSNIEDEVNKYGAQLHSLCLRKETELVRRKEMVSASKQWVSDFDGIFCSLKQEIIQAYIVLSGCSSSRSSSCMRDDELVHFIDLLVRNLIDLLHRLRFWSSHIYNNVLFARIEVLEDKLTFLKNFVCFAKLQGIENHQLENLLIHIEVVALDAARLSFMCSFYEEDKKVCGPKMCLLLSELIQMSKPVDARISETYITVLGASKSSAALTHAVGMDKQIISGFNDSLITILWELLWCNTSFVGSVKDEMKLLYEGLRFLRSILGEPPKMDKLNENIRVVIVDAGVIIFLLSWHQTQKGDVDSLEIGRDLVNINRDIKLIGALGSLRSDDNFKQQVQSKISSLTLSKAKAPRIHEAMVDLPDEVQTVTDRLLSGSNQLEIVPIVGMPGLGKTTLAKTIFSNPSIKYHFHVSIWCCVSQSYNKKNVLRQILGYDVWLTQMDENDLLLEVYRKLKENKYLIVFDDVWDIAMWNDFRMSFPNDENGSRILITSRFSNVVLQMGKPHHLRPLTSMESWKLLQKKVFEKEDCPEALQTLGMEIAKNCKGLPLTIVVIAGILAMVDHDVWEEVAKSFTSTIVYEMDQQCKNTLELSYIHLPNHLKPCLLYFCAFPEDQEIHIQKLTWMWMAEGFVQNAESKRLEDVAEEYLVDLIGRNLIMVTKQRSTGGAKACCVHDLIHEFCKAKAKEENFLHVLHGYDELSVFIEPPKLRRLSIHSIPDEFNKSGLFCPSACTLLFFNHNNEYFQTIDDISFICYIYKHLRVLNIEQLHLIRKDFPREIALLVQLRFLAAQSSFMNCLPQSIANLTNLETFVLRNRQSNTSLPDAIWNMKKLRHLHIKGMRAACLLPTGNPESTSSLDSLDTFSCLGVSLEQLEDSVKRIPNVRRLRIKLMDNPFKSCNTTLAMDSLRRLERLELEASKEWWGPGCHIEYCFPSTLRELYLTRLHSPWSKISVIEDLPNLEVLKLLRDSFVGERWEMKAGGFPKLRFLKLEDLDVVEWTDDDAYDSDYFFPCLEKLVLKGNLKFEKVPSCLHCIPTLEMIQVKWCMNEIVRSLVWGIEKEQKEFGNENLKVLIMNWREYQIYKRATIWHQW